MSNGSAVKGHNTDPASTFAWGQYRVWAATSREIKAKLTAWQFRALILFLAGAVLGTLSEQIGPEGYALPQILGFLSALVLGVAAFFSKEILGPTKYQTWVRARSAAEALKSQVYLFLTKAPPYNVDNSDEILIDKVREISESVQDVTAKPISDDEKRKGLPPSPLSIESYIDIRVNGQIDNYYNPMVRKHGKIVKHGSTVGLTLGVLAVILGIVKGSDVKPLSEYVAGWIGVVSTATASVSAYIYAGRHQYLTISYQTTARQLEALLAKWRATASMDTATAERNQFIQDSENTISIENSAWMTVQTKRG